MIITLPHEFNPRPYQHDLNKAFFVDGYKRMLQVLHRRGGKSKNAINFLLGAALKRKGTYYHAFPKFNQAKRIIWNGIDKEGKRYLDHIPSSLIKRKNNSELLIELINGSIIQLAGTDHYNSLMGGNPAGIVFDEYSLQTPLAWNYLRPILAENGGWALFIYTPRGKNHGYDLWRNAVKNDDWFVQKLGVDETRNWDGTPVIHHSVIDEERDAGMPEELIQQEFFCSFDAAIVGAYYSKELELAYKEKRVHDFQIRPGVPVFTFWDLGVADSTAIWFMQPEGGRLKMVNYYENNGHGIEHYIKYVNEFSQKYKVPYKRHFAPHDIEAREFITARTRREMAFSLGINFDVVKKLGIMDGIQAARSLFNRVEFHETNCQFGLRCLQEYHRKHLVDDNGVSFRDAPEHNWASHGADAFRYFGVAWNDYMPQPQSSRARVLEDWHP